MGVPSFEVARLPRIVFGEGSFARVGAEVAVFGNRALLVVGSRSLATGKRLSQLQVQLAGAGVTFEILAVEDEPTPELVDAAVERHRGDDIEVVLAVGGGSVLDTGKAVAGLLRTGTSVLDHLEGVGRGVPYRGPAVPLVAVPTTAGTGSEATKNAVLSRRGPGGFKRSFRDPQLVPRLAIVDPELLASLPAGLMAAQGMDAFTQLLEGYVSLRSSPFTDALAWSGMEAFVAGFWPALEGGDSDAARGGRSRLAYASLLSGIVLAQAGLGAVHGLAAALGGQFDIPHGAACGTLVAEVTMTNLEALRHRAPCSPANEKYARVGRLVSAGTDAGALADTLAAWVDRLQLPRLSTFGVTVADLPCLVADSRGSSMRTNPVELTDDELETVLRARV